MPDVILLPLQVPTAPEGFCATLGPNWVQQMLNLFGQSVAVLNSGSGAGTIILNQESVPGVDQHGFLWFRPSVGRIFRWDAGGWIAPHLYPRNDPVASLWVEATPNQIWAFDGGDGSDPMVTAPDTNVGAMWIIDPNYAGRSPMGVGAIPSSTPAKNLALGENFGEGSHTQTEAELVSHVHGPKPGDADQILGHAVVGSPATYNILGGGDTIGSSSTGPTGGGTPFNVTHPVRGGYRIIRSNRANYIAGP